MIPITNDTVYENSETVNVALGNPTGGAQLAAPSSAVLTITDNDAAPTVQVTGEWATSTVSSGFVGAGYRYRVAGDGSSSVTWPLPASASAGTYEVFAINQRRGYLIENQAPGQKVRIAGNHPRTNVTIRLRPKWGTLERIGY